MFLVETSLPAIKRKKKRKEEGRRKERVRERIDIGSFTTESASRPGSTNDIPRYISISRRNSPATRKETPRIETTV